MSEYPAYSDFTLRPVGRVEAFLADPLTWLGAVDERAPASGDAHMHCPVFPDPEEYQVSGANILHGNYQTHPQLTGCGSWQRKAVPGVNPVDQPGAVKTGLGRCAGSSVGGPDLGARRLDNGISQGSRGCGGCVGRGPGRDISRCAPCQEQQGEHNEEDGKVLRGLHFREYGQSAITILMMSKHVLATNACVLYCFA